MGKGQNGNLKFWECYQVMFNAVWRMHAVNKELVCLLWIVPAESRVFNVAAPIAPVCLKDYDPKKARYFGLLI